MGNLINNFPGGGGQDVLSELMKSSGPVVNYGAPLPSSSETYGYSLYMGDGQWLISYTKSSSGASPVSLWSVDEGYREIAAADSDAAAAGPYTAAYELDGCVLLCGALGTYSGTGGLTRVWYYDPATRTLQSMDTGVRGAGNIGRILPAADGAGYWVLSNTYYTSSTYRPTLEYIDWAAKTARVCVPAGSCGYNYSYTSFMEAIPGGVIMLVCTGYSGANTYDMASYTDTGGIQWASGVMTTLAPRIFGWIDGGRYCAVSTYYIYTYEAGTDAWTYATTETEMLARYAVYADHILVWLSGVGLVAMQPDTTYEVIFADTSTSTAYCMGIISHMQTAAGVMLINTYAAASAYGLWWYDATSRTLTRLTRSISNSSVLPWHNGYLIDVDGLAYYDTTTGTLRKYEGVPYPLFGYDHAWISENELLALDNSSGTLGAMLVNLDTGVMLHSPVLAYYPRGMAWYRNSRGGYNVLIGDIQQCVHYWDTTRDEMMTIDASHKDTRGYGEYVGGGRYLYKPYHTDSPSTVAGYAYVYDARTLTRTALNVG